MTVKLLQLCLILLHKKIKPYVYLSIVLIKLILNILISVLFARTKHLVISFKAHFKAAGPGLLLKLCHVPEADVSLSVD